MYTHLKLDESITFCGRRGEKKRTSGVGKDMLPFFLQGAERISPSPLPSPVFLPPTTP
jgi:hypothetical protein